MYMKDWVIMSQLNLSYNLWLNLWCECDIPFQIWILNLFFGLPNLDIFFKFEAFIWFILFFPNFYVKLKILIYLHLWYIKKYLMQFEIIVEFWILVVPQPCTYGVKRKVPFVGILCFWNFNGV